MTIESARLEVLSAQLSTILQALSLLDGQYMVSITNPPYIGSGKMPADLSKFVKKHYPNSKSDLFAVFMERLHGLTVTDGYYAMITQHQWMFLSSFEALRQSLSKQTFINLAHLGTRAFEEIGGEVVQSVAFVMQNSSPADFVGTYERLVDFDSQSKKEIAYLEAVENPNVKYVYRANQANFGKIPGSPIAYWSSERLLENFKLNSLKMFSISPSQNVTGNNSKWIRKHWEISNEFVEDKNHWIFYAKGGGYRKWYGNLTNVINWSPNARIIYEHGDGKHASQIINKSFWYRRGITWGLISSAVPSFREMPEGATFDKGGSTIIVEQKLFWGALGLLNSKVLLTLMTMLNPTLNFQVRDIQNVPIHPELLHSPRIDALVHRTMDLSEIDWDTFEDSWRFIRSSLLAHIAEHTLSLLKKIGQIRPFAPNLCQIINYIK